jgi:hypothetical protein
MQKIAQTNTSSENPLPNSSGIKVMGAITVLGIISDLITVLCFSRDSILEVNTNFVTFAFWFPLIFLIVIITFWGYLSWNRFTVIKKNLPMIVSYYSLVLSPLLYGWFLICLPGLMQTNIGSLINLKYIQLLIISGIISIIAVYVLEFIITKILGIVNYFQAEIS